MVTEAARVVAPTSPPHEEPGTVSYVNIPNNYWTESPTVRDSVTVVGQKIPLVWTPTSTTWDFGDGSTASGDGVEGADVGSPDAIEHSYARQGSYQISTTTTYNLTFMVPGQGAQTIPLTATPSEPVTLPVREIQTLVDFTR
jgi:PKD domain